MVKKRAAQIPVTVGSSNVFADLGFREPEEELTKAQLASLVRQVIARRRLSQVPPWRRRRRLLRRSQPRHRLRMTIGRSSASRARS